MENELAVVEKKNVFSKRIHELDFARGILMVLVIMDHLFNLLGSYNTAWAQPNNLEPFFSVGNFFNSYINWGFRSVVRYICLGLFVFLSGISSAFSKNNWKRAGKMLIFWLGLFVITGIGEAALKFEPFSKIKGVNHIFIFINIIGVIAFSVLLYCPFQGKKWYWLLVAAVLFIVLHIVLVLIKDTSFGKVLQEYEPFFYKGKSDADFMPLVPYVGIFFLGALFSEFTYCKHKESYFKRHNWEKPICFLGRHSLIIYMTHFVVMMVIFSLIGLFIKR